MKQPLPLSTLPQDGIPYRVDLMGNILRNSACSQNHLVDIFVRPLREKIILPHQILSPELNTEKLIRRQISIGEIGFFSPLSIFVNGSIYSRCTKPNMNVDVFSDTSTTLYITASYRDNVYPGNNYIIPYSRFRLGLASAAPITAIGHEEDPYSLLIPTAEIIRYFYLSSTRFNQHIFSSDVLDNNLLANPNGTRFNHENRSFCLKIRKNFPNSDAGIISELILSKHARINAQRIWGALIKTKHDKDTVEFSPKVGFPFIGHGKLSGIGIELPTPKGIKRKRRLIFKITDCKYQLPFDSISLDRDNSGRKQVSQPENSQPSCINNSSEEIPLIPIAYSNNKNGKNNPLLQASPIKSALRFKSEDNRFSHIRVMEVLPDSKPSNSSKFTTSFIKHCDQTSTPTKKSNSPAALISIERENTKKEKNCSDKNPDDLFNNIKSVIYKVCKNRNINAKAIKINSREDSELSYFPIGDNSWCNFINSRRLYLSEINHQEKHFYIMEVERFGSEKYSTIMYYTPNKNEISEGRQYLLIKNLSWNSFIKYENTFNAIGFTILRIPHYSISNRAHKIKNHIFNC